MVFYGAVGGLYNCAGGWPAIGYPSAWLGFLWLGVPLVGPPGRGLIWGPRGVVCAFTCRHVNVYGIKRKRMATSHSAEIESSKCLET
jgi:hypothetical protein